MVATRDIFDVLSQSCESRVRRPNRFGRPTAGGFIIRGQPVASEALEALEQSWIAAGRPGCDIEFEDEPQDDWSAPSRPAAPKLNAPGRKRSPSSPPARIRK